MSKKRGWGIRAAMFLSLFLFSAGGCARAGRLSGQSRTADGIEKRAGEEDGIQREKRVEEKNTENTVAQGMEWLQGVSGETETVSEIEIEEDGTGSRKGDDMTGEDQRTEPADRADTMETMEIMEPTEGNTLSEEEAFYLSEITPELETRIRGLSYKEDCPVPLEDLRYLHVLHKDLQGEVHEGEMICNKVIAEDVLEILKELYEAGYPIERMRLVDEYGASDEASMEDNNSSSFNFRYISYTTIVSKHGLGLAVDINTLYNPYIKTVDGRLSIEPENAGDYVDRDRDFPYKIERGDLCYNLFIAHGFEWGGDWEGVKDYQHFELSDEAAEALYPGLR